MRGRIISIPVELLDILTMVALRISNAKETLLEDRVFAIPQRQRECQTTVRVRDACNAVFTPAISPRPGRIVGEVGPSVAIARVVFTYRSLKLESVV